MTPRPPYLATSPTEGGRIRVLLVDDHQVVRRGLRTFLDLQDDIEVVGEATDGAAGVAQAKALAPDVILMDLMMPVLDGVSAIAAIKAAQPEVEIVAVTSFIEEDKVTAALEAGASGYLLKDADADAVANAVRAAHAGEVHLDPAVARLLAQRMRERKTAPQPVEPLTEREKEVLSLVGQGASNKEIASALFITERTARTHVSNILGKLGLSSRTQAALYAVEHKLVQPKPSRAVGGALAGRAPAPARAGTHDVAGPSSSVAPGSGPLPDGRTGALHQSSVIGRSHPVAEKGGRRCTDRIGSWCERKEQDLARASRDRSRVGELRWDRKRDGSLWIFRLPRR